MKPMNSELDRPMPQRQRGQTLVVALIIMGLLLIIGFIFISILSRNIKTAGRMQTRSLENDLSEAGIRYAHSMLLNSESGADWRGTPTYMPTNTAATSLDPDIYYLRPPAYLDKNLTQRLNIRPGQPDLGGPDGLGPFIRVNFRGGRALVRVSYAPSDINIANASPTGALRNPGLVRNYLIIESVGRSGQVNISDPTTLSKGTPTQYAGFGSDAALRQALATMGAHETVFANKAVNRAFASIGIIESARYITNKYKVSRPAEIGISDNLGVMYDGLSIAAGDPGNGIPPLSQELGTSLPIYNVSSNPTLTAASFPIGGSLYSNADLVVHGHVTADVNQTLGDKWVVNGTITGANAGAQLTFNLTKLVAGAWTAGAVNVPTLDSRNPAFNTTQGLLVDGLPETDVAGYARGAGEKVPPSITSIDPATGVTRYVSMTRDSGATYANGNNGALGYGRGVYVSNAEDRQTPVGEVGLEAAGADSSLEYDWLNPNNGKTGSGWNGFLYSPVGAYVQLISDGFVITRSDHTWLKPDGTDSGVRTLRYRLGIGTDNKVHVINTYTPGIVNVNGNLGRAAFSLGPVFNGVLYFEGNVRVRGTIPTDAQLSIVSNATIYIEGSITKGVIGNGLQSDAAIGARLPRLSDSMLMLMASDYVALNSTQFFGVSPNETPRSEAAIPNSPGFSPLYIPVDGSVDMQTSFVLDPSTNPTNPSLWRPYATNYTEAGTGTPLTTNLLVSHAMDNGGADSAFLSLNINQGAFDTATPPNPPAGGQNPVGLPQSTYYFQMSISNLMATLLAPPPAAFYIYGMGEQDYQRFANFETAMFPLVDPSTVNVSDPRFMVSNNNQGLYTLFSEGTNDFLFHPTNYSPLSGGNYMLGKVTVVPHDVKIEASIFAENGSFFVIPGQWTNPNSQDRRDTYASLGADDDERRAVRLEKYGAYPGAPFYGEAPDVRVNIVGAISENMPPSMDEQSEWIKKLGWIPRDLGASGLRIPSQHVPSGVDINTTPWVPNLTLAYDPVLATARAAGFNNDPVANPLVRVDDYGRALPPLPRLPVSPALAFFGEVR